MLLSTDTYIDYSISCSETAALTYLTLDYAISNSDILMIFDEVSSIDLIYLQNKRKKHFFNIDY